MTREKILDGVKSVLVDALMDVEEDEIKPSSILVRDLGAESIDFLDIAFRLGKKFNMKVILREIFPEDGFQDNPEFVQNGRLTDKGLQELRVKLPDANIDRFLPIRVENISDLLTVDYFVNYITRKLERQ